MRKPGFSPIPDFKKYQPLTLFRQKLWKDLMLGQGAKMRKTTLRSRHPPRFHHRNLSLPCCLRKLTGLVLLRQEKTIWIRGVGHRLTQCCCQSLQLTPPTGTRLGKSNLNVGAMNKRTRGKLLEGRRKNGIVMLHVILRLCVTLSNNSRSLPNYFLPYCDTSKIFQKRYGKTWIRLVLELMITRILRCSVCELYNGLPP